MCVVLDQSTVIFQILQFVWYWDKNSGNVMEIENLLGWEYTLQINNHGIKKLLKGLNIHKATGPEAIPTRFLHDYAEELAPIMTFIFQLSLDTGNIPDDWRETNMVVLYKKGERHQASNYRPVSLTSVSCRILEHVIHSQIMDHFDRWNILTDKQHGFRRRRSCESQLIITIDALAKSLAKGEQVDVILLDFS